MRMLRGWIVASLATLAACSSSDFNVAEADDSSVTDSAQGIDSATSESGPLDTSMPSDTRPDVEPPSDTAAEVSDAGGTVNFAREVGAAAGASTHNSSYPPARVIDGLLETSWFAAGGTCSPPIDAISTCAADAAAIWVTLADDRVIGRVKLYGNRESPEGWDVLTGKLEIRDATNVTVYVAQLTFPAPYRDLTVTVPGVLGRTVRLVVQTAEATAPGIAELGVYGP
jgi:hypothetical protein